MTARAYGSRVAAKVKDPRATWHWRAKVRPIVLQRDRYVCHWNFAGICRGRANTVDHIVALAEGGAPYDLSNLVAACGPCNSSRSPGGRKGWVKGQGQRNSHSYAPPVRISQDAVLAHASLDGSSQSNEEDGRFFSVVDGSRCARSTSISPTPLPISSGFPALSGATQRPTIEPDRSSGFPRLSGYYGHPRGAG